MTDHPKKDVGIEQSPRISSVSNASINGRTNEVIIGLGDCFKGNINIYNISFNKK
jgi:hypothetical protein